MEKCKNCNTKFKKTHSKQLYCSSECRDKWTKKFKIEKSAIGSKQNTSGFFQWSEYGENIII